MKILEQINKGTVVPNQRVDALARTYGVSVGAIFFVSARNFKRLSSGLARTGPDTVKGASPANQWTETRN